MFGTRITSMISKEWLDEDIKLYIYNDKKELVKQKQREITNCKRDWLRVRKRHNVRVKIIGIRVDKIRSVDDKKVRVQK